MTSAIKIIDMLLNYQDLESKANNSKSNWEKIIGFDIEYSCRIAAGLAAFSMKATSITL